MKYIKQLSIILLISFLGELIHYLLPLPIPASIYGLILLFVALLTGIVPLSAVKETGNFLIEIMPLMFIPSAVGLMESWGILQPVPRSLCCNDRGIHGGCYGDSRSGYAICDSQKGRAFS